MKHLSYWSLFLITLIFLIFVTPVKEINFNNSNAIAPAVLVQSPATIAVNSGDSQGLELKLPDYPVPTKLKIDNSKRFLIRADGSPFVWARYSLLITLSLLTQHFSLDALLLAN
jgi:hypothetical protein